MYDLQKSRDALLKVGFSLAAIEFARLKELTVPVLGQSAVKLDQLGIRSIGAVVFSYLALRWVLALLHHYRGLRAADGRSSDTRKSFAGIVRGLKPLTWLEVCTLAFEVGAPIVLVFGYTYLVAFKE